MSDLLFTKDTTGDRQNVIYGRPDKNATPKYRTAGMGFLVGLSRDHRIFKSKEHEAQILQNGVDTGPRSHQQSLLSTIDGREEPLLAFALDNAADGIRNQMNYVSIGSGHVRKRRRVSDGSKSDQKSDTSSSSREEGSKLPVAVGVENGYKNLQIDPIQTRQRRLQDQTLQDPDNIEAWFALIELQQDLINEQNGNQPKSTSQKRLVNLLRLSVFEAALPKVRDPLGRTRLIAGLMKEGAKVWDSDKQFLEWQRLLKENQSFEFRKMYISFMQCKILDFTVEKVVEIYQEALSVLVNTANRQEQDGQFIYMILRLTLFLHQSGFTERAAAIWQALLEFNLFRPASVTPGEEMSTFEEFWDSEAARIGEPGAKGWSGQRHEKEAMHDTPSAPIDNMSALNSWCEAEQQLSTRNLLPARTFDFTDDDDTYRVILFQDIRQFLFRLDSESSKSGLINAFLSFVGLPTLLSSTNFVQWSSDPLICKPDQLSPVQIPFTGVADALSLFEPAGSIFSAVNIPDQPDLYSSWTSRTLQLIALAQAHTSSLGEAAIAFEACRDLPSARKLVRKLLKQSPDNYRLYNAYALLEAKTGDFDAAEKVWTAALTSQNPDRPILSPKTACLWHSWIWSCILRGDSRHARALLQKLDEGNSTTTNKSAIPAHAEPNLLLHGNATLRSKIELVLDEARSNRDMDAMPSLFGLLALLEYLSNNQELLPALASYTTSLALLNIVCQGTTEPPDSRYGVELLHQYRARLIDAHVRNGAGSFRPQIVLDMLQESAEAFPHNSIFLDMLHTCRQKYGLIDRLRDLPASSKSPASLMQYFGNIQSELLRPEYAGSNEHTIRAVFLRAVEEDSPVRTCPAIRLLHVRWEIGLLEKVQPNNTLSTKRKGQKVDRATANALNALHSALQVCPWLKQLYITALSNRKLVNALEPSGTRALYHAMLDRGIRVHIDISDLLNT